MSTKVYDERPKRNGSNAQKAWDYFERVYPRNGIISLRYVEADKAWEAMMSATCRFMGPITRSVSSGRLP